MSLTMTTANWLNLFGHYVILSLMSVGGGITTAPEMHRYLVDEQHWLRPPPGPMCCSWP